MVMKVRPNCMTQVLVAGSQLELSLPSAWGNHGLDGELPVLTKEFCCSVDGELSSFVDSDFESDYNKSAEEIESGELTTAENLTRFHLSETVTHLN